MKDETFWRRVVEAFETDKIQEIARKVGISYAAVRKWKLGELPSITTITAVSRLTNSSIHWLATGDGPKDGGQVVDALAATGSVDNIQAVRVYLIERLSELVEGRGTEEIIRYLIGELARLNGEPERHEAKRKEKQ